MPPTALDRGTRFQRQNDGRGKSLAYTQEPVLKEIPVAVSPPWGGYTPDITDDLASLSSAEDCLGIIERDGDLTNVPGFARLQNSTPDLPLGTTTLPAAAVDAEPVIGLFQVAKRDANPSYRLAVTGEGTGATGHLYEWSGTAWARRAPLAPLTDHNGVYTSANATLADFAYIPWGAAGGYTGTAGQIVFCNSVSGDPVYVFPNNANEYLAAPFVGMAGITNAKSVSNYFSRLCLFNVTEAGTNYPHRFMWFAPAGWDITAAGAGYLDVDEGQGQGLRCLPIADHNALYFDRSVAFISRTGSGTAPFRPDYITKQRGPIGPKAVCSIGSGSHFGIYTDGWLVLDANGQFTELGTINNNSRIVHKWHNTFYDDLSVTYASRTVCGFDTDNHIIVIAYVSKTSTTGLPDRVLYYDLKNDTLWPDDYTVNFPTAFSEFDATSSDITWDTATGDWDDATRAWDIDIFAGRFQFMHGTHKGLVHYHSRGVNTKDSQSFVSRFTSKRSRGPTYDSRVIYDKLAVEYKRIAPSTSVLDLNMYMDETSSSHSITLSKGNLQSNQIDFMTDRLNGRLFGWGIAGVAPLRVRCAMLKLFIEGGIDQDHGS